MASHPYVPYASRPLAEGLHGEALDLEARSGNLAGLDALGPNDVWRIRGRRQPITDTALEHLPRLVGLEALDLTRTKVTDAGMHAISRLPRLRHLCLNNCKITDIGLRTIGVIESLEELELCGTAVTDDGLRGLLRHPNLRVVDLRSTKVRDVTALETIPTLREVRR